MDHKDRTIIKGEASIYSVIARLLLKWRWLFLIGVICAGLAGAYTFYSQKKTIKEWKEPDVSLTDTEKESSVFDYSVIRERTLQTIAEKKSYINDSILLRINQTNVSRANVDFYITTSALKAEYDSFYSEKTNAGDFLSGGELSSDSRSSFIVTGMTSPALREADRILDHYCRYVLRTIDYTGIAEEFGTQAQYIRELISISSQNNDIVQATITVVAPNTDDAQKILNFVIEKLLNHQEEAENEFGEHLIKFRNQSTQLYADLSSISNAVTTRLTELNALMKQYNDLKTNEASFKRELSDDVSKQKKPGMSLKKIIIRACIGFIGGAAVGMLVYLLFLILGNRVLSARDVNSIYGLKKLGSVSAVSSPVRGRIDKMILANEFRYLSNPDIEKCYEIINGNIRNVLQVGKKVALVGDVGNEELSQLKNKLENNTEIEYVVAGDITEPVARKQIEESDGVVVVAKVMKSQYRLLNDLMQELANSEQNILGSIVL